MASLRIPCCFPSQSPTELIIDIGNSKGILFENFKFLKFLKRKHHSSVVLLPLQNSHPATIAESDYTHSRPQPPLRFSPLTQSPPFQAPCHQQIKTRRTARRRDWTGVCWRVFGDHEVSLGLIEWSWEDLLHGSQCDPEGLDRSWWDFVDMWWQAMPGSVPRCSLISSRPGRPR